MNSPQHMVCFLLYACLAASGYQTSHSSQLLALMKDLFAFGDKDGITDSQLFFQERGADFSLLIQTLLLGPLPPTPPALIQVSQPGLFAHPHRCPSLRFRPTLVQDYTARDTFRKHDRKLMSRAAETPQWLL